MIETTVKITVPMEQIAAFCQRWHIIELALFGSVLEERFAAASDLDILVTFAPEIVYTLFDLSAMQEELEVLFGRPVDLLDKCAVQQSNNYLRRKAILNSAQTIYATG